MTAAAFDDAVDQQTPASDSLADEMILMSLLLARFSARTSRLIEEEMRALAAELVRILMINDFTQVKMESARTLRLKRLLDEADVAIKAAFGTAGRTLVRDIKLAIEVAGEASASALNATLGFERARAPDEDRVIGMASVLLVEGKSAIEWWKKIAGDAKFRFTRILQDGYQRKLGLEDMVRAIRGTGAKQFNDGFLAASWRAASALARTAIAAGAEAAQAFTWNANADVVGAVIQISVLDLRTSTVCKAYSRKMWSLPDYQPIDHKLPYNGGTPRHWHCRSIICPVARAYDALSPRFQTKIAFQQRAAAFNGAAPADLDYGEWLKTQSVARQKAALGGRYTLWKAGELSLEDMLDPNGSPLSIRELRKLIGLG